VATRDDRTKNYKRVGVALSAVAMLSGLIMIGAIYTSFGPSPRVGLVFGGLLILLGALRLYWTLKR
jgi:uncharacterized membrane protein